MTILYKVDYQIKLLKEQVQQINNTVVMAPMAPNHLPNQEIPQQPPRTVVTTQQPIESQSVVTDSVQDYIKTVVTGSIDSTDIPEMISKEINRTVKNVDTDAAQVAEKSCEEVMRTFGIVREGKLISSVVLD